MSDIESATENALRRIASQDITEDTFREAIRDTVDAALVFAFARYAKHPTPSIERDALQDIARRANELVHKVCESPHVPARVQQRLNCAAERHGKPSVSEIVQCLDSLAWLAQKAESTIRPAMQAHQQDEAQRAFLCGLARAWMAVTGKLPPASRKGPFVRFVHGIHAALLSIPYDDGGKRLGKRPSGSTIEKFCKIEGEKFCKNEEAPITPKNERGQCIQNFLLAPLITHNQRRRKG